MQSEFRYFTDGDKKFCRITLRADDLADEMKLGNLKRTGEADGWQFQDVGPGNALISKLDIVLPFKTTDESVAPSAKL